MVDRLRKVLWTEYNVQLRVTLMPAAGTYIGHKQTSWDYNAALVLSR